MGTLLMLGHCLCAEELAAQKKLWFLTAAIKQPP